MTQQAKKEFRKVIVEGIAMYPSVHVPKKAFTEGEPPSYTLDLVVDEANAKILLAEGLKLAKVKVDEDTKKPKEYAEYPGLKVFALRRKTINGKGEKLSALIVQDSQGERIPPEILVGNGSKIRVSVNPWTVNIKGKEITGSTLLGVQVLELVEYKGASKDPGFEKVQGFTVPKFSPQSQQEQQGLEDEEHPFN